MKNVFITLLTIPALILAIVTLPVWAGIVMIVTGKSLKDFAREANAESGIA